MNASFLIGMEHQYKGQSLRNNSRGGNNGYYNSSSNRKSYNEGRSFDRNGCIVECMNDKRDGERSGGGGGRRKRNKKN